MVEFGVGAAPTLEAISDVTTETGAVPLALAQILAVGVLTAAAVVLSAGVDGETEAP